VASVAAAVPLAAVATEKVKEKVNSATESKSEAVEDASDNAAQGIDTAEASKLDVADNDGNIEQEKPTRAKRAPRKRAAPKKPKVADADASAQEQEVIQPELALDDTHANNADAELAAQSSKEEKTHSNEKSNAEPQQAEITIDEQSTVNAKTEAKKSEKLVSEAAAMAATPVQIRVPAKRVSSPMANPNPVEMPEAREYFAMSDEARGAPNDTGTPAVISNASSKASAPMATPPSA